MIYEYDFFDRNQLRQVLSLFDAGKYVDGSITGPKEKEYKDNTQQQDIELNKMVNSAIAKVMKESHISDLHPFNKVSPCYMLKYEVGQHYADHVDFWNMWGNRTDYTAVITLNDDYEGGDLEIDSEDHYWTEHPRKVRQGLGSVCVFPSDTYHRVTKVTKGTRYSLVVWVMGDPWK